MKQGDKYNIFMMKIKHPKTHLPSVATFLTIHKCCHGFICASCLYLNTQSRSIGYNLLHNLL